jgi:hypothetical protein
MKDERQRKIAIILHPSAFILSLVAYLPEINNNMRGFFAAPWPMK